MKKKNARKHEEMKEGKTEKVCVDLQNGQKFVSTFCNQNYQMNEIFNRMIENGEIIIIKY